MTKKTDISTWSHAYLGGQIGSAWNLQNWQYNNLNYFNKTQSFQTNQSFGFSTSNFIIGGYAGFNYQSRTPWLIGFEGAFSGTNLSKTEVSPFNSSHRYTSSLNEWATVKGRLGYSYRGWLPYVSGGGAFANTSLTLADQILNTLATTSPWHSGWTVGAGLDYRLNNRMAVGLTYDYSDVAFNTQPMKCTNCLNLQGKGSPNVNGDFIIQAIMARLSYFIS